MDVYVSRPSSLSKHYYPYLTSLWNRMSDSESSRALHRLRSSRNTFQGLGNPLKDRTATEYSDVLTRRTFVPLLGLGALPCGEDGRH